MKNPRRLIACLCLLLASAIAQPALCAQSSAFTYQGRFTQSGLPFTGAAEFQFTLWDAAAGGNPVATNNPVSVVLGVTNGLFMVPLDFGMNAFPGADRWLQVEVRTAIGPFTPLLPRQALSPTPYALRAASFSGAVDAAQLPPNVVRLDATGQVFTAAVQFNNPSNVFAGTFAGNGTGMSNLLLSALLTGYSPIAWGNNQYGQSTVPPGLTHVAKIAGGFEHTLALKDDGTVVGWGGNKWGQASPSPGLTNMVAIAAGLNHSLGVSAAGTIQAWGDNALGQTTIPSGLGTVIAIAAGGNHSVAVKSDGTVVAWGSNGSGETNVPAGLADVTVVAAGEYHSLALKGDGTLVGWGYNRYGQAVAPNGLSNVIALAAGGYHSLALKADGTVVAWGFNNYGQTNVPAGMANVTAVAAGRYSSLALKRDGTVVAWGENTVGQTNVPPGLTNVFAIGAGTDHYLALRGSLRPAQPALVDGATFTGSVAIEGSLAIAGQNTLDLGAGLSSKDLSAGKIGYQVFSDGLDIVGAGYDNTSRKITFWNEGGATFTGPLNFGSTTRQMLNLWGTQYGIGVQNKTLYFRTDNPETQDGFAWYKGGSHSDTYADPGPGGVELMHLVSGGLWVNGTFVSASDRNSKEHFGTINALSILEKVVALPLATWNYKNDPAVKHLGPMAQDFQAAFDLGPDDKHIATVDADGVALAAIQGLNQKLVAEAKRRDAENAALKQELSDLKKLVLQLQRAAARKRN